MHVHPTSPVVTPVVCYGCGRPGPGLTTGFEVSWSCGTTWPAGIAVARDHRGAVVSTDQKIRALVDRLDVPEEAEPADVAAARFEARSTLDRWARR